MNIENYFVTVGNHVNIVFHTNEPVSYSGEVIAVNEHGFKIADGSFEHYISWSTPAVVTIENTEKSEMEQPVSEETAPVESAPEEVEPLHSWERGGQTPKDEGFDLNAWLRANKRQFNKAMKEVDGVDGVAEAVKPYGGSPLVWKYGVPTRGRSMRAERVRDLYFSTLDHDNYLKIKTAFESNGFIVELAEHSPSRTLTLNDGSEHTTREWFQIKVTLFPDDVYEEILGWGLY